MILRKSLIILLLIIALPLFPYDLRSLNGNDWFRMTYGEKIFFIDGYMLGQLELGQQMLDKGNILDYDLLLTFMVYGVSDIQVVEEITAFYLETTMLNYPLYIVVILRNMRNIPPWDDVRSEIWQ